jgi:hypothetical protein
MAREIAEYPYKVNDLSDIDPHQIWSPDNKYKIGAAVSTGELLAATAATKGVERLADLEKIAVYYISSRSDGKGGLLKIFGNLVPYFIPSKKSRLETKKMVETLQLIIRECGGETLGSKKESLSTVHIFGSMGIGESKLITQKGFLKAAQGKIFVRDASILPSHPFVNPQGPLMHLVTSLEEERNSEA